MTYPDVGSLWRYLRHHAVVGYVAVDGSRTFPTCFVGHVQGRSELKSTEERERVRASDQSAIPAPPCPHCPSSSTKPQVSVLCGSHVRVSFASPQGISLFFSVYLWLWRICFSCLFKTGESHTAQTGFRLTMWLRMILNSWLSCLCLPNSGIIGCASPCRFLLFMYV